MDFFELIESQHEEVENIIDDLEGTTEDEIQQREQLYMTLKKTLIPHMEAEEAVFYPELTKESTSRQDALEAIEEHHAAKLIMGEMDSMPKQDERWSAKLVVLRELVQNHIEEEESTIFDDARETLSESQLDKIMQEFQKQQQQLASTMA